MSKNKIEDLKKLFKRHNKKKKYPCFENYLKRLTNASMLLTFVLHLKPDSMIRNEARKNYVINLVTALEVFCNELIIERKGKWSEKGLSNLLEKKEKITYNIAFELKALSKEHLILYENTFQNIESIERVFSELIGKESFIKEIMEIENEGDSEIKSIKNETPNWRNQFSNLFQLRHRIIHEGDNTPIKKKELNEMDRAAQDFTWACLLLFGLD